MIRRFELLEVRKSLVGIVLPIISFGTCKLAVRTYVCLGTKYKSSSAFFQHDLFCMYFVALLSGHGRRVPRLQMGGQCHPAAPTPVDPSRRGVPQYKVLAAPPSHKTGMIRGTYAL